MKQALTRTFIGVVGFGVALSGAALPAVAATPDGSVLSARATGFVPDVDSTYMAGHDKTGANAAGTSTFTVPDVDCPSPDIQGIAIGVAEEDISGSPTVMADVFVACLDGAPFYLLDTYVNGVGQQGTANAGDKIKVTVTQSGANTTATAKNITTGETVTVTGAADPNNLVYGAFPLFAGTPDVLPVPDFGNCKLTKNKFKTNPLGNTTKLRRVNDGVEINATALGSTAARPFTLKFVSN